MNTPTESRASAPVTEADASAFLHQKAALLRTEFPTVSGFEIKLGSDGWAYVSCYTEGGTDFVIGVGKGIDAALAEFRRQIKTPEQQAAEKRKQAEKLLEEAAALAPTFYVEAKGQP